MEVKDLLEVCFSGVDCKWLEVCFSGVDCKWFRISVELIVNGFRISVENVFSLEGCD